MRIRRITEQLVVVQHGVTDLLEQTRQDTNEVLSAIVDVLKEITTVHHEHVSATGRIVGILEAHADKLLELSDALETPSDTDIDAPSVQAGNIKEEVEKLRHDLRGLIDDDFPMLAE